MNYSWHLILMAIFYILSGANHMWKPELYFKMIPSFLVYKDFINFMTGFLQILFGISLLIPNYQSVAASSIVILLFLIFPSNLYMIFEKKARLGLPLWIALIRLPLQFALVYWAYQYVN
jgi:uncharacterized membrane protein